MSTASAASAASASTTTTETSAPGSSTSTTTTVTPRPVGVMMSGNTFDHAQSLSAAVVVVGLGAGGAMAARELARAGVDVIGVEEGSDLEPGVFDQREDHMLPLLFAERGGRMTDDLAISVMQGRGVGGSTLHNTNLCKRTPPELLDLWARRYGLEGCSVRDLEPIFSAVERDLSVGPIPESMVNRNNQVLRRGIETLGWKGGALQHNRKGCVGSGFCELGCAYDAKQNARKVLIPTAVAAGARLFSDVRVSRVLHDRGSVSGIVGVTARGHEVTIHAKVVVLAGSAVGSAALAIRSGLPDPHGQLGQHLHLHPGGAVAGVFDAKLESWRGIPQSWECTEWLDFAAAEGSGAGASRRVWITTAFAHPIGTAASLPGFGAKHMQWMRTYPHLAVLTAMVHDETNGQVYVDEDRIRLRYRLSAGDQHQLAQGLRAAAHILLAASAREVLIPSSPPRVVRTRAEVDALDDSIAAPHVLGMTAVHPMGSMRMGADPRFSVVGSTGEHHQLGGLFVTDSSLFPTSIGVPPQLSVYAFALHLSRHVIEAARRR